MIYFNKLIDICINRYESQKVVDNYFIGIKASNIKDLKKPLDIIMSKNKTGGKKLEKNTNSKK